MAQILVRRPVLMVKAIKLVTNESVRLKPVRLPKRSAHKEPATGASAATEPPRLQ